jgi:hypothetical protein
MTTKTRPNFDLCKALTKRHGLALPHVMPEPGEKVSPFRTTTECVECHIDPVLAAAAFDCRCRLKRTHDGETCACGIVWHHQDNGPTRAIRLIVRAEDSTNG